jgi:parafibromin
MILEGAAGYFNRMQQEREDRNGRLLSPATPLTPASPDRRIFGLAPWHRRNSHESILTVSSSVHRLLQGKTPAATPVTEGLYQFGGKEYAKGDRGRTEYENTLLT